MQFPEFTAATHDPCPEQVALMHGSVTGAGVDQHIGGLEGAVQSPFGVFTVPWGFEAWGGSWWGPCESQPEAHLVTLPRWVPAQ